LGGGHSGFGDSEYGVPYSMLNIFKFISHLTDVADVTQWDHSWEQETIISTILKLSNVWRVQKKKRWAKYTDYSTSDY
jgi:hypothetical protein